MSNLSHLQVESSFITLLHVNQLIFSSCAKEQLMNATLEGYDPSTAMYVLSVNLGHMLHNFGLITCLLLSLHGQPTNAEDF